MMSNWLPASSINVGDRLRQDLGDITGLAQSIDTHGLLHPIVVDANNNLIAGERRLRAMQSLGWTDVEIRRFEELTESERRVVELEENLQRKDLTAYERSRNLADLAESAAKVDQETGEVFRAESAQKPGRPKGTEELGSTRRVAERIGIPDTTIREAKKHVAAVESFAVLQKPEWKQYQAMEAAELLNSIPVEDQKPVMDLIDQPGIPPRDAIEVIRNVAQKAPEERKQIVRLATSEDDRDRSLALTKAAQFPPMPDGRSITLRAVVRDIRKCIKAYPMDPEVEELESIIKRMELVIQTIDERHQNRVETAA